MMRNRRRLFLMLSLLLFLAATTTVAAGTNSSVERRKQSSKNVRGRSRRITQQQQQQQQQQRDGRILALSPDWDLDDRREWDFRARKVPKEPKEPKSPKTEPDGIIDVDDNIDDDQYIHDNHQQQQSPSDQPSLSPTSPTSSPTTTLEEPRSQTNAATNAAVAYETSKEQETKSSATSPGMTVGVAVSGMGLVVVFLFFAHKHQRRRKLRTAKELLIENGELTIEDGVVDEDDGGAFTGVYKLRENLNLNEFMEAIGVSWAVRSATVRARPIHYITHEGNEITMKFKGIPRATYIIDGPAVDNVLVSRTFACKAKYTEDNHGFEVHQEGIDDDGDYNIHLRWSLADDNDTVRMTMAALFKDENREPVQCTQIYQRIGEF